MRQITLLILTIFILSQSFLSLARPTLYPIFDVSENLPRNLRAIQQMEGKPCLNVVGLNRLKASGSGQFSEENFSSLLHYLSINKNQLLILDLRQESHGLVNGKPICWTDGVYNYGNLNKTREEVESDEYQRLRLVAQAGRMIVNPIEDSTKLSILSVQTEREFVEKTGCRYKRLPVTDHNRPSDAIIDEFVQLVHCLPENDWIHFHCRAGKGRTTTFLVLLDIMRNAQQVNLEDILARQHLIGGANLKDFSSKEGEKRRAAQERLEFIQQFYIYCRQVPDFHIKWSSWVNQQSVLANNS